MKDCPEVKDVAHFVETGEGSGDFHAHLAGCDACQDVRRNLEDEARSLEICISEIWFREQISCPDAATLERFRKRTLIAEERDYVAFHLETLDCPTCQGRQEEAELVQSPEGRRRASTSKQKVHDASIKLMGEMTKGKGR
jgi:hypothetical protein